MTECGFSCECFGETNQGMERVNNEDTFICQHIWDDKHILCAAIDGLGGYEGGEIAAELARTTIIKHLEDFASPKTGELLKAALIDANNVIISQHQARPEVSRMGCVASVGIIDLSQGIVSIAHVGDSRIYQFANGKLKKLTHDHSLVGYREETGELSEEDAMNHPKRNVIDKFLGEQHLNFDSEGYVEISIWPVTEDSQYLFCSDGLTDLVTGDWISRILSCEQPVKDKVKRLISSANDAGGKDNITVVLTDIRANVCSKAAVSPEKESDEQLPAVDKTKFGYKSFIIGGIIGLMMGICIMYAYQRIAGDSDGFEIHNQADRQQIDCRENIGFRPEAAIPEDSVARLSTPYKMNSSDSAEDKAVDNQSSH